MITVSQLTLGFKGCEPILDNVSFHLKRGEILSVLGPNGAGKTTLLRHVAGLCRPLSGVCQIGRIDNRPARLAYVPQAKTPHFAYGVLDFVTFGCARQAGGSPGRGGKISPRRRRCCTRWRSRRWRRKTSIRSAAGNCRCVISPRRWRRTPTS